jgi:CRISPR/Cas system-associated exonuclease Cas4 (RecB family)
MLQASLNTLNCRRKHQVDTLDVAMVETIRSWEDIVRIVAMPKCPVIPENANCRNCAFFDLCHITEP